MRRADNITALYEPILYVLQTYRPPWSVTGIASPLFTEQANSPLYA
jgi:hypothetical protein